jgi:hypothetical protein
MMKDDSRGPEEIKREIERERAGLTDALDGLQNKFSVESIARQVSDQFREHGGDIGRSVSEAVKRNPVALALTGVGLAWLMMGDKSVRLRIMLPVSAEPDVETATYQATTSNTPQAAAPSGRRRHRYIWICNQFPALITANNRWSGRRLS